jgi:nicotinamidase-related amidase
VLSECQSGMLNADGASNEGLAGEVARRAMVARIADLAQACRNAGVLVVHATIVPRPDYVGTGSNCLLLASLVKKG